MAQKLLDVLEMFLSFVTSLASNIKYLAGVIDVRDKGVAGSNPATPTRFPNNNPLPPQVVL